MSYIRDHVREIIFALSLFVVYFFTRLYNIMALPLFTDEAIYTRWSQIARYDAAWRFISLTDGKQPSFVWLDFNVMRFTDDPLLAGRLVSVGAGFLGLIGIFLLAREIFRSTKIGFLAALLFVFYPFALVYDRMALYDSLVTMFSIWSLYFLILLVRKRRLDIALLLGMILGGGVLTKTSAFLSIYMSPALVVLFDVSRKNRTSQFFKWIRLLAIAIGIAYAMYMIQRLSPFFHIIEQKNLIFVYSFEELRQFWFRHFGGNIIGMFDWLSTYMTYPVLLLALGSFAIKYRQYWREKLLLLIWFGAPFLALALFARLLYPRFIYFMTIPLLILAAYSLVYILTRVKNKAAQAGIVIAFLILFIRADYYIITNFARAPIPNADKEQYINGWPAGGGIKETIAFLENESKNKKIYVLTEGTFGSLPTFATEIYLDENKNIEKRGIYPLPDQLPQDIIEKTKRMPVYFVMYQLQEAPAQWPLKLIARYQKGVGNSYLHLYQVVPN